jgi:SAM-dependent methyltransferase
MKDKRYLSLARHYEACFDRHGDNHKGMDWPNQADAEKRYRVMLDVIRPGEQDVKLLDYGCGASHLYDFLAAKGISRIEYSGLDVSKKFVDFSRAKHPGNQYYHLDLLEGGTLPAQFDYIVANGVFTEKRELSFDEMFSFFRETVGRLYAGCRRGIAFNVMSKHVDWEREDLFHVPMDAMADFLKRAVSRHYVFRSDYGLYEYTIYVYREPLA